MALVDDMVRTVQDSAALPPERAQAAVQALLRLLGARLPSPLYGELQAHMHGRLQAHVRPEDGLPPP